MKVNDFFCGAGGFGLGFKNEGFEIAGAWDFDKFAVQTYAHNIGSHVQQADVSEMKGEDIPLADVWTFGFPCQDISIAGKQKGMDKGTRSGLFYEIMRLLDEVEQKPSIILAENVKNVRKYLPTIKEEYAKSGYVMYAKLYNSKYWGVPQNRERWFILGVRKDLDKGIFRWEKQQEEHIPKLSSILESEVDEKYYYKDKKFEVFDEPKGLLKGKIELQGHDILKRVYDINQAGPTANTCAGGNLQIKVFASRGRYNDEGKVEQNYEPRKDNVTNTLTSVQKDNLLYDSLRVRKLTPREYARLQGFPESFEQVVSNSQFYKQMGNAVTVNVAQAVARAIRRFLG